MELQKIINIFEEHGFNENNCSFFKQEDITDIAKDVLKAINYTHCCTELPMIEELIISEIRRKHQKQVDDEVERLLNGNGTDCRLRGFFNETDLNE